MSHTTVDDILDRIKRLPDEDRLLLDELLAKQEDQEWREEAAKARKLARNRGIDQEAIDRAVYAERQEALKKLDLLADQIARSWRSPKTAVELVEEQRR